MTEVLEVDAQSKDRQERDFNDDELAARLVMQSERETLLEKEIADRAAMAEAVEHAKSLGFTDAMIAVMYPNLGGNNE